MDDNGYMSKILDGGNPKAGKDKPTPPSHTLSYEAQRNANASAELTPEEIAAIREKARLTVLNEIKDRAEKDLLAQFLAEERQQLIPEHELVDVYLNLASHSLYIMLDGKQYLHEHWYRVTKPVFAVLTEQMNRGWAHDDQTQVSDSKGRRRWRPPVGIGFDNFSGRVGPWGANRNLVVGSGQLAAGAAGVMKYVGPVEAMSA
jgi:hypothetical protein